MTRSEKVVVKVAMFIEKELQRLTELYLSDQLTWAYPSSWYEGYEEALLNVQEIIEGDEDE